MRLGAKSGVDEESVSRLMAKLRALPVEATKEIRNEVAAGALMIQGTAQRSMTGTKGGTTRTINRDGMTVTHTASAPGEPPAIDTGKLVGSVTHDISPDGLTADIGTNALEGLWMELGTKTIEPRPWLFPAFESQKARIVKRIAKAIDRTGIRVSRK